MQLIKMGGELNYGAMVMWKTPGFETNDLGYLREADQILPVIFIGFHEKDPKGIYRYYNINATLVSLFNFGGDWTYRSIEGNFNIQFYKLLVIIYWWEPGWQITFNRDAERRSNDENARKL